MWLANMIRALDIFLSMILLIILCPVFVAICMLCLVDDGPVFFRQKRLGKNRVRFTMYKFRTLPVDTPQVPTHDLKGINVSAFGKFLRSTKLDELPQLFNVFKGDMSLVGPRPCLESQAQLVRLRSESNLFSLRPGITGAAQLRQVDMKEPVKLVEIERAMVQQLKVSYYFKAIISTTVYLIFKRHYV